MDIALAGLVPLSFAGADRGQKLQRNPPPDRQGTPPDARQGSANDNNARPVRGEIVSAGANQHRRVNTTEQSILEREATFSQSDTRRFSLRVQYNTEAPRFYNNRGGQRYKIVSTVSPKQSKKPGEKPRQISGIIDEYV